MTFHQFLSYVNAQHTAHPEWRYGQTLMNCLYEVRPEVYGSISTAADPFYFNKRVPAALSFILERW